jgi:hypothetical protein
VEEDVEMTRRVSTLVALGLVVSFGFAKDKTKNTLPAYVLQAQTVAILIDPGANFSIDGPQANLAAQKDVEAALLKWGRFQPVSDKQAADLIIVVRKGNERLTGVAVPDPRQTNGGINSIDRGGPIGPQRGSQPNLPAEPGAGPSQQDPTEIANAEDYFAVFKGGENPRDATPAWRYVGRDGLNPLTVPAVAAFKKAVANAEKAATPKP